MAASRRPRGVRRGLLHYSTSGNSLNSGGGSQASSAYSAHNTIGEIAGAQTSAAYSSRQGFISQLSFGGVPGSPVITQHPVNQSVQAGSYTLFRAAATGNPPLSYQWQFEGTDIPKQTNWYLAILPQSANAGSYRVVASNAEGFATSDPATLTVVSAPPVITQHPTNLTVQAGGYALFRVSATGSDPRGYQWQFEGVDIPGKTNSWCAIIPSSSNAGIYRVVITNAHGFATSQPATLTVLPGAPVITQHPSDITIQAGGYALFRVSSTGSDPRGHQWQFEEVDIPGQTNWWCAIIPQPANAGSYRVVITNAHGFATSQPATLTVLPGAPVITQHPSDITIQAGGYALFRVASTGSDPRGYQWQFEEADLPGQTNWWCAIIPQPANAGSYRVVITNAHGFATSQPATLTVLAGAPVITQHPSNLSVPAGGYALFRVSSTGSDPRSYQWQFEEVDIPSQTNWWLAISNPQEANEGSYRIVITNSVGLATSQAATLTVVPGPPVITQDPINQTVQPGNYALFRVASTGSEPRGYQWQFEGVDIPGKTNWWCGVTNSQAINEGSYRVVITNALGTATSAVAVLAVSDIIGSSVRAMPAAPVTLKDPRFTPGLGLVFEIEGAPGMEVLIEASTDLNEWQEIALETLEQNRLTYVDRSGHPRRFYRVRRLR